MQSMNSAPSPQNGPPRGPGKLREQQVRNKIQVALAVQNYKDLHPEAKSDFRLKAVEDWIGNVDATDSLAARFGNYVDEHGDDEVDPNDQAAITKLLADLKGYNGKLN